MWKYSAISVLVSLPLIFATAHSRISSALADPTTQTMRPPTKIILAMPAEVSISGKWKSPLRISLSYESDETRRLTNYAFMFLLLDENGKQVAVNPFYREAVVIDIPLTGREPIYEPRIAFDPHCKQLIPGKKYQIICVVPSFGLADSAWFTLVE